NQTTRRIHVSRGRKSIRPKEERAPKGATSQTKGVLKRRGRLGSRTRRTKTPIDTITKASNVPILQRSPAAPTGRTPPKIATITPVTIVTSHGVLKRGWTLLTN